MSRGEAIEPGPGDRAAALSAFPDWTTRFDIDGVALGGPHDLANDPRFELWRSSGAELAGARVLELGPLEGGHTLLMHRAGARQIVAVEGRPENFAKCCLVQRLFGLDRARFVLADVGTVGRERFGEFDLCLASGILYHLEDPAPLLARLAEMVPAVMVWTHFATRDYPALAAATLRFAGDEFRGKWYREPRSPRAGLTARSFWPYLPDLRRLFHAAGFAHVDELAVDAGHFQGGSWQGTLWRDAAAKPPDSLWRDADAQPLPPEPRGPRAWKRLARLARAWAASRLPRLRRR